MKAFKHNPHPIDQSDFMYGRTSVMGGHDYEKDERKQADESASKDKLTGSRVYASVNKLRRSVSERLFSMELGKISF